MFKIQENEDGSTSIYDKNNGKLLCTIPGKRNSNVPRKVNVVEPQPVKKGQSSCSSDWCYFPSQEPTELQDEKNVSSVTRESKCCLWPIPLSSFQQVDEDYFDDCITQDEFAKCLNLISKEKLQMGIREELLAEYPLRLLSRSRAFRTRELPNEVKLSDDTPLTSSLGMKILHLNEGKHLINEQKATIALKRYDGYCRHPFNASKPTTCHFPKLRCREKKQYPVTTASKILRQETNHFYTYGRRQRMERLKTLKTGLDTRSRRLFNVCRKKTCTVVIKRLSEKELKWWRSQKCTCPPPPPVILPAKSTTVTVRPKKVGIDSDWQPRHRLAASTSKLNSRVVAAKQRQMRNRKCSVYLPNVIRNIYRRQGGYYFGNTSIRIPFYLDFISMLHFKRKASNVHRLLNRSSTDHVYSLSTKKENLSPKATVSNALVKSWPPVLETLNCRPIKKENTETATSKTIPIIDLTDEATPPRHLVPIVSEKIVLYQWKFHCFGCNYHRLYFNCSSQQVDSAIQDHMVDYHSVRNAETFLSRYLDRVNHCTIIEAFPGYKGS